MLDIVAREENPHMLIITHDGAVAGLFVNDESFWQCVMGELRSGDEWARRGRIAQERLWVDGYDGGRSEWAWWGKDERWRRVKAKVECKRRVVAVGKGLCIPSRNPSRRCRRFV